MDHHLPSSSNNKPMEKPPPQDHPLLPPPPQQVLKCPRCDSSNTKFCYYNNYSLSQPRHFCKACKRYWTRGGTLRNVPVGGGCRKNKRVKRPQPNNGDGGATSHVQPPPQIDLTPVSNHISSSLFYNLPTNPLEASFPFSRFSSGRAFDFHQPASGFGLGFSSALLTSEGQNSQGRSQEFNQHLQNPVFMGSAGSNSSMTSLLASLQQPKMGTSGLMSYDQVRGENGISNGREVIKMEGENRLDHQHHQQHQHEHQQNNIQVHHHEQQQMNTSSDPNSSLLWNTSNISSWFDPSSSMGSSVPSLI